VPGPAARNGRDGVPQRARSSAPSLRAALYRARDPAGARGLHFARTPRCCGARRPNALTTSSLHRPRPPAGPPPDWEYVAPDGSVQGPYPPPRMVKWLDGGYFPDDLQLREVGRDGWASLDVVTARLRRQAAALAGGGGGGGEAAAAKLAAAPTPAAPAPAADAGDAGGRGRGRGRGRGTSRGGPTPPPKAGGTPAPDREAAVRLFTAGAKLATDEPVWRYVDPGGSVRGPFPARSMLDWHGRGFLDASLPVCGCDRKVSAPNLPPAALYAPLGELLSAAAAGSAPAPASVDAVKAALAAPGAAPAGKAATSKPAAPKAGRGVGGRGEAGRGRGRGEGRGDGAGRGRGRGRAVDDPARPRKPHVLVSHMVGSVFARVQGMPEPPPPPPREPRKAAPKKKKEKAGAAKGDTAKVEGAASAASAPAAAPAADPAPAAGDAAAPAKQGGGGGGLLGFFGFGGKK